MGAVAELFLDGAVEIIIEILDDLIPHPLAVGYVVEILLNLSGETIVHDALEVLVEIVGHDDADILCEQFAFLLADSFGFCLACDVFPFENKYFVAAALSLAVTLGYISALHDGRDGRGVGRRTADAELLELLDQAGLGVAHRPRGEAFHCVDFFTLHLLSYRDRRHEGDLFSHLVIVGTFDVNFQEAVEKDFLSLGYEGLRYAFCLDVNGCLLNHCISHLACDGAFPDKAVELLLVGVAVDGDILYICGADGLVGFLCAFSAGLVFARP